VRKARRWLDERGADYRFFDYRVERLDPGTVGNWIDKAGWETVLNRNSTTFRELPEAEKSGIDAARAKAMLLAETNLIKRPVLDVDGRLTFGFKPAVYEGMVG
jgi:Spx/MgsR family transcriptional regulator